MTDSSGEARTPQEVSALVEAEAIRAGIYDFTGGDLTAQALAALGSLLARLEAAERELVDVEMDRRFQQDRARTAERELHEERERFHRHVETMIEPQLLARVEKAERALAEVRARLQKLNVTQMDDHDAALVRAALRSSEEVSDES